MTAASERDWVIFYANIKPQSTLEVGLGASKAKIAEIVNVVSKGG